MYGEILAFLAAFFGVTSTFAYLHQAYWIWKRKSSADVSIFTFAYFFLGQTVMLLYSFHLHNIPYIITWIANMTGSSLVILLTIIYRKPKVKTA
jgi:uncharacterized protein with PQ loop repeat